MFSNPRYTWAKGCAPLSISYNLLGRAADPLNHLIENSDQAVMAVITGVEGPSYRPVGAIMALGQDGSRVGTLSSGCIEGDLLVHAKVALESGRPISLRYGQGSPFIDIKLPCGGGLDILLVPRPDVEALGEVRGFRASRKPCSLDIDRETGGLSVGAADAAISDDVFRVNFIPEIRFLIFGRGPEASTFASLAHSIGYPALLLSPDAETREDASAVGCPVREITRPTFPEGLGPDQWTAVVAFFHDHDWEPEILASALESPAFYIGAQGSRRSAMARIGELEAMGTAPEALSRLRGPIGLVASARDARTLAVSVLAEVLEVARAP